MKRLTEAQQARRKMLDANVKKFADIKNEQKVLALEAAEVQSAIEDLMDSLQIWSVNVIGKDGAPIKATMVQASRVSMDESSLKSKLGAAMWKKVTTLVLDKRKLDAHIKSGEIDPMVVASVTTETPNKPYVKVT